MSREFNAQTYGSEKGILAFPDHYVAIGRTCAQNHALATTTPEGEKIIKAGTIFPANDATAIGVVMHDVNVTKGDANATIIIHGFIKTSALPTAPDAEAITALNQIKFLPLTGTTV